MSWALASLSLNFVASSSRMPDAPDFVKREKRGQAVSLSMLECGGVFI
jgi:hypothetical protein